MESGSPLDSLDKAADSDMDSAWHDEILLRFKELDEGKVKLVPWAEARRQIAEG